MGYRVPLQAAQTKLSTAFLLWWQCKCHTDTDMGGTHCQSAMYHYLQNDKKTCILLAVGNHAKAYTDVSYRFHLVYGKSTEWWTHNNGRKSKCTTKRTWLIWLGGLGFQKIMRNYLYKGNSERISMLFKFYRTAIISIKKWITQNVQ